VEMIHLNSGYGTCRGSQRNSASFGTMPTQNTMAKALIIPANAKASVKCPVRSTTRPVIHGAIIPERLPTEFWIPTQRPEARGPARICDIA